MLGHGSCGSAEAERSELDAPPESHAWESTNRRFVEVNVKTGGQGGTGWPRERISQYQWGNRCFLRLPPSSPSGQREFVGEDLARFCELAGLDAELEVVCFLSERRATCV